MEYNNMKVIVAPDETVILCKDQETIFGKPDAIKVILWHKDKGAKDMIKLDIQELVDAYIKLNDSDYR